MGLLGWAFVFLLVALIAGGIGLTSIARVAVQIARVLFVIFLILFIIFLVMSFML
jgi:uncharacterized membrane protein YtjA (UPF0391 family)